MIILPPDRLYFVVNSKKMFNLQDAYLTISWHIFFQTNLRSWFMRNGMKITSTTGKMFENTFFSYCCPSLLHLWLKNLIPDVESTFHELIFQSYSGFYNFMASFFNVCSKKHHFSDSKHFPRREFNFHGINVQSTAGNLISTNIKAYLRMICK